MIKSNTKYLQSVMMQYLNAIGDMKAYDIFFSNGMSRGFRELATKISQTECISEDDPFRKKLEREIEKETKRHDTNI